MCAQRIVVDDSDSSIQYSGSAWSTTSGAEGQGSLIYEGSQHSIKGNGGFSFAFNGTSIDLYGTGGQVSLSGKYDPLWACHIDKQLIGGRASTTDASGYWPLCSARDLSAGTHEVTVEVTGDGSGAFLFDRLVYTPTNGIVNGTMDVMWIGSSNSAFQFDDEWSTTSNLKLSNKPGASVSLQFSGRRISWIGDVPGDFPGNASSCIYAIDGGEPVPVQLPGHDSGNSATVHDHVFFTTPELSSGTHSIKVTYNGNFETPISVSYVLVTNATFTAFPSPSSTPSPTHSPVSSPSNATSPGKSHPVGAIAGGVVGGVLVLILVIFLLLWRRRRASPDQNTSSIDKPITPFLSLFARRGDGLKRATNVLLDTSQGAQVSPLSPDTIRTSAELRKPQVSSDPEAPPPPYGT